MHGYGGSGGFTGGNGGASYDAAGSGGGSFDPGTPLVAIGGENSGAGFVTIQAVCFAAGTLIRALAGDGVVRDVAVEHLRVGDLVVTAAGAHRPIRWLGHRRTDCGGHPHPRDVRPIRIAAHAFDENRPARDLLVSPGHAICVPRHVAASCIACWPGGRWPPCSGRHPSSEASCAGSAGCWG